MVVTNLFQDTAGRRRWRDEGAVGMEEDAMRRDPLSNHGNSAAERFPPPLRNKDLNQFAFLRSEFISVSVLFPKKRLACRTQTIAGEEKKKEMSFAAFL